MFTPFLEEGSNPAPLDCKSEALPTELCGPLWITAFKDVYEHKIVSNDIILMIISVWFHHNLSYLIIFRVFIKKMDQSIQILEYNICILLLRKKISYFSLIFLKTMQITLQNNLNPILKENIQLSNELHELKTLTKGIQNSYIAM